MARKARAGDRKHATTPWSSHYDGRLLNSPLVAVEPAQRIAQIASARVDRNIVLVRNELVLRAKVVITILTIATRSPYVCDMIAT